MTSPDEAVKHDRFVSIASVLPADHSVIEPFLREMNEDLGRHFEDHEIVLVDHRPGRGGEGVVRRLLEEVPCVRLIELSSPVDHEVAMAAAVENSIGDYIVLFTPSVDPVSSARRIVERALACHDVVIGVATSGRSIGYRLFRPCIQLVLDEIDYRLPRNATDLRCLSRRAVNSVMRTRRFHQQFLVRIANTGYPSEVFPYEPLPTSRPVKTLGGGIREAIHLLVFNSTKPLRWMSCLGVFGSLLAFVFSVYSLVIRVIKDDVIEGWTSMVLFMSLLFMLLFMILAFFGEYLGRLLDDRSEHCDYSIADETSSDVMLNADRINVLSDSSGSDRPIPDREEPP